jgi:Holliday junction resolvase-like predicted endonuclease
MSTLAHEHDAGQDNLLAAELSKTLETKRAAVEGALKGAPQGRHAQERAVVQAAEENLIDRVDGAVRDAVEAFFASQRDQLNRLQQGELDIVNAALDSSNTKDQDPAAQRDALRLLGSEVDQVGSIHREEHARLARERAELESALGLENRQEQLTQIADLRQRQDEAGARLSDTLDAAEAFAEGSGKTWTAAEEAERTAGGAVEDLRPAPRSTEEADNPNTQARGNLGEKLATDWLAANDFDILNFKPSIDETTRSGIDMVAMKDDTVYLLDNKALSRDGNVNSVSALTTNLVDNLSNVKRELEDMAKDAARTAEEIAVARKALEALEAERYVLAVTNANIAKDDRILSDVTERLKNEYDIQFIDVMKGKKA